MRAKTMDAKELVEFLKTLGFCLDCRNCVYKPDICCRSGCAILKAAGLIEKLTKEKTE
jgi:hypothetical protein